MSYLDKLFSVAGKTALVTGAATGIGRMVATGLVRAGAQVMIASRKGEDCLKVANELNALGGSGHAEGFAGDVSSEAGIAALVAEVKARTQRLHILVNNAGISWGAPLQDFPYHAWAKVFGVNVTAVFHLTRELLPLLDAAASDEDPARVINLGSVMGTQPLADDAYSYTASKAAVHHLTRTLALEFAARRITVNAFAPGPFQSRMTALPPVRMSRPGMSAVMFRSAVLAHRMTLPAQRSICAAVRAAMSPAPSCQSTAGSRCSMD